MSGETTELKTLSKLKKAGKLRYWRGTIEIPESELHAICDEIQAEHEQAIAATLESDGEYEARMDALLCRLTNGKWSKSRAYSLDFMVSCVDEEYEDAYEKERADLGSGTLTAEQVREAVEKHWHDLHDEYDMPEATALPEYSYDWQAVADELNELGSDKEKDLLLRTFGLAQMMYGCWLEECKAGDNVDVSACNAYSYEFDQIAQAMFDVGIDPNDSDYYRSAELGSGTCEWVLEHSGTPYDKWRCSGCGYLFVESRTDQGIKEDFEPNFCPRCGAKIRKAVGR